LAAASFGATIAAANASTDPIAQPAHISRAPPAPTDCIQGEIDAVTEPLVFRI